MRIARNYAELCLSAIFPHQEIAFYAVKPSVISETEMRNRFFSKLTLHKISSFPLRISSVELNFIFCAVLQDISIIAVHVKHSEQTCNPFKLSLCSNSTTNKEFLRFYRFPPRNFGYHAIVTVNMSIILIWYSLVQLEKWPFQVISLV